MNKTGRSRRRRAGRNECIDAIHVLTCAGQFLCACAPLSWQGLERMGVPDVSEATASAVQSAATKAQEQLTEALAKSPDLQVPGINSGSMCVPRLQIAMA